MQRSSWNKPQSLPPETETLPGFPGADSFSFSEPEQDIPSAEPGADQGFHTDQQPDTHAPPLHPGPLGTYYQYPDSYQGASGKGMSAEEKQALGAGLFVMVSLAAALGVGWWATPPSPPALADIEERREQQQARIPAEEEVLAPDTSGGSNMPPLRSEQLKEAKEVSRSAAGQLSAEDDRSRLPPKSEEEASPVKTTPQPEAAGKTKGESETSVREEEVRRLKAEAYSETKKDRLGKATPAKSSSQTRKSGQSTPRSGARAAQARKGDLSKALAKCDNEIGLFFRERCKWRLCNGRWGENGCPSFQHDARAGSHIG